MYIWWCFVSTPEEKLIRADGFLLLSLRSKPIGSARDNAFKFTWSLSRMLCFVAMFSILLYLHPGHDVNHLITCANIPSCVYDTSESSVLKTLSFFACAFLLYSICPNRFQHLIIHWAPKVSKHHWNISFS